MHGQNPNAKFHHQMEAAKHLTKLGLDTALSLPTAEDHDEGENLQIADSTSPSSLSDPITDSDIINYKVARLIREETNDGYLIAEFLSRVMHGTAGQGRPISEADRIRAATELMNRGLGRFGDKPDRRISNTQEDYELINSGLARYIREHTDHGLEPARFLLDVASGQDEGFTMHQRVTATRELIRRGWDTNYEAITPEDIAAYYERQEAREPTGYDNRLQEWHEKEQQKQSVGATGRSPEDEPQPENRHSCGGRNPDAQDRKPAEEPQLEAGLFAHLSFDEIDRYEAMSAEEQAEFVEKQRQYRASRKSAGARAKAPSPSTGEGWDGGENLVHPEPVEGHAQHTTTSPSTGAQKPPLLQGEGWGEGTPKLPSPSTDEDPAPNESGACDGRENPENINWNTLPQDDTLSTNAPPPTHPVKSQTHIRSP